jgi:acyl-CoA reductase-like NAD-dependent aldehyde dehydrogenase
VADSTPYWVAGQPASGTETLNVHNPYDDSGAGTTTYAAADDIERAIALAHSRQREIARTPSHVRAAALDHVSRRLADRAEEISRLITAESGKPIRWSRLEVQRGISTFRWAAEEARRFSGELQRLDTDPGATGRLALVRRAPRGPVLGITPFNFPLNLVAHKVAPAIAAGAPIVIKPAPATPLTALVLGELLAETDLPEGAWSVLPVPNSQAPELVADPRLPVVSFTGSGPVGHAIRESVPHKHVTLELGGNAAAFVCPDWTDLDRAAQRIATFATYQGGQSCIAVQRVYAHADVYDELSRRVVDYVGELGTGSPFDESTDVGPLINTAAAERVQSWVDDAVVAGARVLDGGSRDGRTVAPTVLADTPEDCAVNVEEVFGPVLTIAAVDSVDEGFRRINASRFGLQTGVFTRDVQLAFRAAAELDVGGVIIGDVPSFRADHMPYGGIKDSGVGREGIRSAMQDMTEERVLVLTGLTL